MQDTGANYMRRRAALGLDPSRGLRHAMVSFLLKSDRDGPMELWPGFQPSFSVPRLLQRDPRAAPQKHRGGRSAVPCDFRSIGA